VLTEYLCVDGVEVANNARTAAYGRAAGLSSLTCFCPQLGAATGAPFTSPALDAAPWYDAADPASTEYLGVMLGSVTGVDKASFSQAVGQLASGYGVAGARSPAIRTLLAAGTLVASSERGLVYGMAWLDKTLQGSNCNPTCLGSTLQCFEACPQGTDPLAYRYLYDCALVDGPTPAGPARTRVRETCDGTVLLMGVSWTHQAMNPDVFWDAAYRTDTVFPASTPVCSITWVKAGTPACAAAQVGCDDTPTGPDLTVPGTVPLPQPPAPPVASTGQCTTRWTEVSVVDTFTAVAGVEYPPAWMDHVPVVEIGTGKAEMRRLSVQFYERDAAGTCAAEIAAACEPCYAFNVDYLPANVTLILDGRTRRAMAVDTAGYAVDAASVVSGPDGAPLDWPAFRSNLLCVRVVTDARYVAKNASVGVSLVGRQGTL
jgi:hypothetical protein